MGEDVRRPVRARIAAGAHELRDGTATTLAWPSDPLAAIRFEYEQPIARFPNVQLYAR